MGQLDRGPVATPGDRHAGFDAAAALLLPAEPDRRGLIVQAGAGWDVRDVPADADVVVWGRPPLPSGTPPAAALRHAVARERALSRLRRRPPAPLQVAAVHRLAPPALRPANGVRSLRVVTLSGGLVELATPPRCPRVLDVVAAAAGAEDGVRRLRAGSGGQGLAEIALAGGTAAILRAAPGGAVDPAHAGDALEALAAAGVHDVPRLLGRGRAAGMSWTAESRLGGRRPGGLTRTLLADMTRFCAALPPGTGPPTALAADLAGITAHVPDHADALRRLGAQLAEAVAALPAVLRHGDLWAGNLLCAGGGLIGVVDWDAWHPRAVPGADLIQLLGTDYRVRRHLALGDAWLSRPWRTLPAAASPTYWRAVGAAPTHEVLDLAGLAWWAAEIAGTLRRLPHRAADDRWLAVNVDAVVADLGFG